MKKFASNGIWNISSNIFVRTLSMVSYPILVRFFMREDIAFFKSFQSMILILISTIPFGSQQLFIIQKNKENSWKILFAVSTIVTLLLFVLITFLYYNKLFIFQNSRFNTLPIIFIYFLLVSLYLKSLSIGLLTKQLGFKFLSIGLMIKQTILFSSIIIIALFEKKLIGLSTLLYITIITDFIETIFLVIKSKLILNTFKLKGITLDEISIKFLGFYGTNQIFNSLAVHVPPIIIIYIVGSKFAPEFQLPFALVSIPASLIMMSLSKVLLPYVSFKHPKNMHLIFYKLLFFLTLSAFPIMILISFFSNEINALLFDKDWEYSAFALKYLPFMIMANILNNPFSSLAAIYKKPSIQFYYSVILFATRISSLFIGYYLSGFMGMIIILVLGDILVRLGRLKIDLTLLGKNYLHFFSFIKHNLISSGIFLLTMIIINRYIQNRYIAFIFGLISFITYHYFFQKKKIESTIIEIIRSVKDE